MLTLSLPDALAERFPEEESASTEVFERWRRVIPLGAEPDGPAHPEGVDGAALLERREQLESAFMRANLLAPVPKEIIEAGYCAIIADRDGVIVDETSSAVFHSTAMRVRLEHGARWDESTRGTNAIGTSLYEGVPVAVVGSAHYERVNRQLVCYAAPIRDPQGQVVAVFDVTSRVENASPLVGPLVTTVAAALERGLHEATFARATPGGLRVLEQMIEKTPGSAWLVGAHGKVLRTSAHVTAPRTGQAFGLPWSALSTAAMHQGSLLIPATRERLELQPIMGPKGRPIAVVVFSHGAARRRTTSRLDTSEHRAFDRIAGDDPALIKARVLAARFASSTLPMILLAETGSGKELFARAIHNASQRASAPFVAVNCGALAPSLLQSELFGYVSGAFTGARAEGHPGMIGAAAGGTLFLDEVAEMSQALQATLLRVLEDGFYLRLGETTPRQANVRIITATCRDLPAMVKSGAFRSDLYYRLRGAIIELPPLRARTDRITLAQHLLKEMAEGAGPPQLASCARAWIESHSWPGNVRELKMALQHATVLADRVIQAQHFPDVGPSLAAKSARGPSRESAEAIALQAALERSGGNLSEAARILGVARTTLYRMKRRHGM